MTVPTAPTPTKVEVPPRLPIEPTPETLRAEYADLNSFWQHNETIGWGAGGILVPMSGAALYASADTNAPHWGERLVLAIGAFALLAVWVLIQERLRVITDARMTRAAVIEENLGMAQHTDVRKALDTAYVLIQPRLAHVWRAMCAGMWIAATAIAIAPWSDCCRCIAIGVSAVAFVAGTFAFARALRTQRARLDAVSAAKPKA